MVVVVLGWSREGFRGSKSSENQLKNYDIKNDDARSAHIFYYPGIKNYVLKTLQYSGQTQIIF